MYPKNQNPTTSRFAKLQRLLQFFLRLRYKRATSKAHIHHHLLLYVLLEPTNSNELVALLKFCPTHKATLSVPKCHEADLTRERHNGILPLGLCSIRLFHISDIVAMRMMVCLVTPLYSETSFTNYTSRRPQRRDRMCQTRVVQSQY